jgi:hypothetical protein
MMECSVEAERQRIELAMVKGVMAMLWTVTRKKAAHG